jgi:hypothetical protein
VNGVYSLILTYFFMWSGNHKFYIRLQSFRITCRYIIHNVLCTYRGPKNSGLTVHYGVEETIVNVRKMFKKFYWTYLLIGRSLKVALNRKIILKYIY